MNLDPRLEESSTFVTDLQLCQVRLSHNAKFPWLLLIPRQDGVREIIDLSEEDQVTLMKEIAQTSGILQTLFQPDKLNIAALGNVVPQLHVHVVARYEQDEAWPHPIWNSGIQGSYSPDELVRVVSLLAKTYTDS